MIWRATYKDGNVHNEYNSGVQFLFSELDKDKLDKFKITETGNEMMVYFSANDGNMKFSNLDLRELTKLNGGEQLVLTYDANMQKFIMEPKSLEFYNSLAIKEEIMYNNIEFDQTGKFYLNGDEFYLSAKIGNEVIDLINQPPYNDIIHFKKAEVDFVGTKASHEPIKKVDNTIAYSIGYKKIHRHNNINFTLSITLTYEVIHKTVTMFTQLGCDIDLPNVTLLIHMGGKINAVQTTIYKHLPPMAFETTLTQLS